MFPGYVMGDEEGWAAWVMGHGPGSGSGIQYVQNYFRYMVTGDPKWNILTADVAESLQQASKQTAADLDSTNPDLSKFRARGSKLIMYHGWDDPAISPWNSIAYYQSVRKRWVKPRPVDFCSFTWCPAWNIASVDPAHPHLGSWESPPPTDRSTEYLMPWSIG